MTSPREAVLVAPGTVTRREWEKEPVELPLSEFRSYDRLARELGTALGTPVRLSDELDVGAWALLVPAGTASVAELPESLRARTLLLDASPAHQVHVVRQGLLGAVMEDALASWRRGEAPTEPGLFGLEEVAARMSGTVTTSGRRFGYATIEAGPDVPDLIARYLEARENPS
jgi:hypothetical protein